MVTAQKNRPQRGLSDVRVNGKLLFRYDPDRDLIEIRRRGKTHLIDLKTQHRPHRKQPVFNCPPETCSGERVGKH